MLLIPLKRPLVKVSEESCELVCVGVSGIGDRHRGQELS